MNNPQKNPNNVIIISDRGKTDKYIYSIISRMRPKTYNLEQHKCIKLWVTDALLEYALELANMVKYAGLTIVSKKRAEEREVGNYTLNNTWEIILEKIPVIQMIGEDFEE